jgi:hypothetical protein
MLNSKGKSPPQSTAMSFVEIKSGRLDLNRARIHLVPLRFPQYCCALRSDIHDEASLTDAAFRPKPSASIARKNSTLAATRE